eukprot:COSAG05_NODE_23390_length_258_cov_0.842767_1_plen_77_part_01
MVRWLSTVEHRITPLARENKHHVVAACTSGAQRSVWHVCNFDRIPAVSVRVVRNRCADICVRLCLESWPTRSCPDVC